MRLTILPLFLLFSLAIFAQNPVLHPTITTDQRSAAPESSRLVTMTPQFDRVLTPEELELVWHQPEMMCTASPPLAILNCQADDRTDPGNMVGAGLIEWRVEGGANPVFCELVHESGVTYQIVGGFGPGFNLYNSPRDFSVSNTTTSQTCILMGMYTIRVTDDEGCVQTCMVNFVPTCFDYASSVNPTVVGSTCNSNGGSINLGAIPDAYCPDDPNAGNVTYQWSNGATTPGINNVPPGFYSVTMTDFYGCEGIIQNIEIPETNGLEITECMPTSPTLIGGNDGTISFNITQGTAPFTFSWVGPSTGSSPGNFGTNTVTGASEGNYTITVMDANGCEEMCTVFVMNPFCTFGTSCPTMPNADNSVSFFLVGGVQPYTVSWSGGDTGSETFSVNNFTTPPLSNGDYTFTIQDANGAACEETCQLTILVVDCATLMLDDSIVTDLTCSGSDDGAIDITLAGGYPDFTFDWSGPGTFTANTEDISGLAAGVYTLNVNDEEGCEITGISFTVEEPDVLTVSCSGTPSNFGDDDGTVTVDVSGGTAPYDLDLNGSLFTDYVSGTVIPDLPPDTYVATITDANGCTEFCFFEVEEIQCDISYTTEIVNPSCNGSADGSITVTIMDAAGDSTIIWSVAGNDGEPVLGGLMAGSYELTVGDTNCILATETIVLTDPPLFDVEITLAAMIDCHGDSTAALSTILSAGVPPYAYAWNVAAIGDDDNPSGLPAGEYQVTVTDNTGCTAADTILITEPMDLVLNCSSTNETASGLNDGTITIDFSGEEPFDISGDLDSTGLTAADAPVIFNNVSPGTYNYTITDANGCTEECTVVVDPGGCIMTVSVAATQPDCDSPNTGSFVATVSDGTAPFTYAWTPDLGNVANPMNVPAGPYELLVTDANGCSATSFDTLVAFTDFPEISIDAPDSICAGECVTVDISLTGTPPFRIGYSLIDQTTGNDFPAVLDVVTTNDTTINLCPADLPPGGSTDLENYSLVALFLSDDLCGSAVAVMEELTINHFDLATDTIRQTFCSGDVVTIAGQNFDENNPGDEIVLAGQSANGCDSLLVVDLTFVSAVSETVNTTLCPGESLTLEGNVFDAATPMGFFLSAFPSVQGCDSIVNVNLTFFPPATGTFTPTICSTDAITVGGTIFDINNPTDDVLLPGASINGCDSTVTVTVNFFPPATGVLNPTICSTDQFVFGGVTFDVDNPTDDVVLTGASVNGCDSTVTVTVDFFPPATGVLNTTICSTDQFIYEGVTFDVDNPTDDVLLNGASVNGCDSTVTVTVDFFPPATGVLNTTICSTDQFVFGGITFDVDNPTDDVVLNGASVNGCDSTVTVSVDFFPPATGVLNTTICSTDQFVFGGVTFDVDNPTDDVVLTGASVNGCDSTVTVTVDFFPPATGVLNTTICSTDQFVFGGVTFDVNNPTDDVVLTGASVNGCDSTVTVTVDFFPPATGVLNTTICSTDEFVFGGVTFDVDNPSGNVVLTGMSVNGCDSTVAVSLDFFAPAVGAFNPTVCPDENVSVGGQTFNQANPSGSVVLAGMSANGCDSTVQVNLSFDEPLAVSLVDIEGNCGDEVFTLTFDYNGGGDLELSLSNTSQATYTLPAGTSSITVSPAGGNEIGLINAIAISETCALAFSGNVAVPQAPTLSLSVLSGDGTNAISCAGGIDGRILAELTGDDVEAYSLRWSNGATGNEVSGLPAGNYSVTATHPNGCSVSSEMLLNEPLPMFFTASAIEGDCFGNPPGVRLDTVDGGSGGPYLYRFDQGVFAPVGDFPVEIRHRAGAVNLEVQDVNGCVVSEQFDLVDPPVGQLVISPDAPVLLLGDSLLLTAQTNLIVDSAVWSPGPDSLTDLQRLGYFVSPTENAIYRLTVYDAAGCSVSSEVMVRVDRNVPVFVPSGFSPNGDGVNDLFTFFGDRGIVDYQDFYIFDRWGDVVHEATGNLTKNDPAWGWDGRHRGEPVNPGVYVFQVFVNLEDGRKELLKGEITLLR
ncbi:hypothetical protein CEQ90_01430 [Lewinellaceae bacterium SD302]|nr:hypothetical protein CEQ90_01430 [Lewinellaceae bacterium SD302]